MSSRTAFDKSLPTTNGKISRTTPVPAERTVKFPPPPSCYISRILLENLFLFFLFLIRGKRNWIHYFQPQIGNFRLEKSIIAFPRRSILYSDPSVCV
ncbi:hypothetical protein CDAR_392811 [Caerostris darwini]|uniref:Uncharacterized protein n=1 Tax=Caerostris darwini TaxID=1538125 RepID=A0AAV4S599_9ARAC|nr:hypothetical protein CDAR_392811 [Caerostris darwini]